MNSTRIQRTLFLIRRWRSKYRLILFCSGFISGMILGEVILWGPISLLLPLSFIVIFGICISPSILLPALIAGLILSTIRLLPIYNPLSFKNSLYFQPHKGSENLPKGGGGGGIFLKNSPVKPDTKSSSLRVLSGVIESPPRYRTPGQVEFFIRSTDGRKLICKGMDLPWRNTSAIRANDHVSFKGRLTQIHPDQSLFSYDRGLLRDGISVKCNLEWISLVIDKEVHLVAWLKGFGDKYRRAIEKFIIPTSSQSEASALFFALTLGARDRVSQETEMAFRNLGLSHLLVLSGYQISLVFGMTYWVVFNILGRFFPIAVSGPQAIATITALLGASSLTLISGFEKPALRAIYAVIIAQIINLRGGRSISANQIAATIFLLTIFSGVSIIDPSIDLTLAAVIGITIGNKGAFLWRYLWSNWCATATTGIIALFWFNEWSWVALVVNPIIAPFLGILPIIAFFTLFILSLVSKNLALMAANAILGVIEYVRDELVYLAQILPKPSNSHPLDSAIICLSIFAVSIARRRTLK